MNVFLAFNVESARIGQVNTVLGRRRSRGLIFFVSFTDVTAPFLTVLRHSLGCENSAAVQPPPIAPHHSTVCACDIRPSR